ncbi:unnamed protein product [Cuscuta europaea]|uniref:RRM domain-containing protein n=1 Tax=Cuscuta europaea TaxID=41803 RepID=A0A9P1EIL1_CUSEU|nr:unnamed protein product [Cuscuta europaea]
MEETSGIFIFPGNLDPAAQEFIPINPYNYPLPPPVHLYNFYYPNPPPPLPLPQIPADPPFCAPCLPPQSQIPTRTLLVSMVSPDVSESLVRRDLEVFGDVRAVQMERVRDGILTVHFYDLRHAQWAEAEIQHQHMQQQDRLRRHYESGAAAALPPPQPAPGPGLIAGRAVWAQFVIPVTSSIPVGKNQGSLVLYNLDPDVVTRNLKDIFGSFGEVKEVRETPTKRQQRFIEFYDIREAANALIEMNGKEINGRPLQIEFSRPGGFSGRRSPKPKSSALSPPSPTTTVVPPRLQESSSVDGGRSKTSKKSNGKSKKIGKNGGNESSSKPRGKSGKETKWWNNYKKNSGGKDDYDPRFVIAEDEIMEESADCRDERTTVMIRNIPNKYSQKLLLNMLDNHCINCNDRIYAAGGNDGATVHHSYSSYDFVYLPIDFINKCNVGYGFVNMTSPEAVRRLHKAFHLQTWEAFNSRKICHVTYARIQGLEELTEHFKTSRFPCDAEEYMPVVFSPPRDGRALTTPVPIFGCGVDPPSPLTISPDVNLQCLSLDGPDNNSSNDGEAAAPSAGDGYDSDGGGDHGDF